MAWLALLGSVIPFFAPGGASPGDTGRLPSSDAQWRKWPYEDE